MYPITIPGRVLVACALWVALCCWLCPLPLSTTALCSATTNSIPLSTLRAKSLFWVSQTNCSIDRPENLLVFSVVTSPALLCLYTELKYLKYSEEHATSDVEKSAFRLSLRNYYIQIITQVPLYSRTHSGIHWFWTIQASGAISDLQNKTKETNPQLKAGKCTIKHYNPKEIH